MIRTCECCGKEWYEEEDGDYDELFICPFCGSITGIEEDNDSYKYCIDTQQP